MMFWCGSFLRSFTAQTHRGVFHRQTLDLIVNKSLGSLFKEQRASEDVSVFLRAAAVGTIRFVLCFMFLSFPPPTRNNFIGFGIFSVCENLSSTVRNNQWISANSDAVYRSHPGALTDDCRHCSSFLFLFLLQFEEFGRAMWICERTVNPPLPSVLYMHTITITSANKCLFLVFFFFLKCWTHLFEWRRCLWSDHMCCWGSEKWLTIWSVISPPSFVRKWKTETLECQRFFK